MSVAQHRSGTTHGLLSSVGLFTFLLTGLLLSGLGRAAVAEERPDVAGTAPQTGAPEGAPQMGAVPDAAGTAPQTGAPEVAPQMGAVPDAAASDAAASSERAAEPAARSADPPARVLRLSRMTGNVSVEPAGLEEFTAAEVNGVLTTGDRVYADPSAAAELASAGVAVRLGAGADVTVSAMTDTLAQFGVAAGSVHMRSYTLAPGTVLEVDSPEAAITVLQPGDLRVDVDPALHSTTIASISGQVQVDSPGGSQVLAPGGRIRLHGGDPSTVGAAYTEPLVPAEADSLDSFSDSRDDAQASGADAASAYVNPDTVGSEDLAANGSWDSSDFGPVWYPAVSAEWRPYCFGHWRYVAPWGWTWVGSEPWAFAPFHYGRWTEVGGRWGWIPGPRVVRPVYAPAMVVFAGGLQIGAALGIGVNAGVTAWFPLGPREPFFPWYTGSTLYRNRVNVSNIYNPDAAEVQGLYNQRAVSVYSGTPGAQHRFVNRGLATVAVSQSSFAAGDPVGSAALRLPAATLATGTLLLRPAVEPSRSMLLPQSPTALPPISARPGSVRLTSLIERGNVSGAGVASGGSGAITLFHRADPPVSRPVTASGHRTADPFVPGRAGLPAPESLRPATSSTVRQAGHAPVAGAAAAAHSAAAGPPAASTGSHH